MRSGIQRIALSLALLAGSLGLARAENPPAGAPAQPPAAPAAPLAVTVPLIMNTTCPIMGRPASKAMFAETAHGRVFVCCPPCIQKIAKDPERAYQAAYPVTRKAGNTVCPVTDKPLGADAVTVLLQGYEIGVCATCAREALAQSQIVLAKALNPKIVEIRNKTCPVTNTPVAPNTFCVIGTDLVHLSSPKAVDAVRADPAKFLAAAKASAAAQGAPAPAAPGGPPTR